MTTFDWVTQVEDPATGIPTPTPHSLSGSAIQLARGDYNRFKDLGLVGTSALVLFFSPTDYWPSSALPPAGATVTWPEDGATVLTVKDVYGVINPDGQGVVACRIIVAR